MGRVESEGSGLQHTQVQELKGKGSDLSPSQLYFFQCDCLLLPREGSTIYQSALHREISASRGWAKFKSEVMNLSRKAHIISDHSGQAEETLVNTVKPQQSQAGLRVKAAITTSLTNPVQTPASRSPAWPHLPTSTKHSEPSTDCSCLGPSSSYHLLTRI